MNDYYVECSCCGKKVSMLARDINRYVYKVAKVGRKYQYQCSYTCWIKETKRIKEEKELEKKLRKERNLK